MTKQTEEKKQGTMVSKAIAKRMLAVDEEIVITADYIANQYGKGLLALDDMADILNVSRGSVTQKISNNTMPFRVTSIGNNWFTTPYSVAKWIVENQQDRSMLLKAG
jgi:hypothetical protein